MEKKHYTFGTSNTAANRLETIALFFDALAEELINRYVPPTVDSILDLGCGPGFTTAMLARVRPCEKICGLDKSDTFLEMARKRLPQCEFLNHDITVTPFPRRADLIYARFLLSHLPEPVELVNRWASEVKDGWLVIDELERVESELPVFQRYLDTNTALIASQGADLYVGRVLGEGKYSGEILCNETVRLPVPNAQAATWFLPNVQTIWESEAVIRERVPEETRRAVREELERILKSGGLQSDITWHMRRIVIKR